MSKVHGQIAGWGAYTPDRILTNHELGETLDTIG